MFYSLPGIPKRLIGLDGTPKGDPPDTPEYAERLDRVSSGSRDSDRKTLSRSLSETHYGSERLIGEHEVIEELKEELDEQGTPAAIHTDPHTPAYDPPETPNVPPSRKLKKTYQDGTPVPVINTADVDEVIEELTEVPQTRIKEATSLEFQVTQCLGLLGKRQK